MKTKKSEKNEEGKEASGSASWTFAENLPGLLAITFLGTVMLLLTWLMFAAGAKNAQATPAAQRPIPSAPAASPATPAVQRPGVARPAQIAKNRFVCSEETSSSGLRYANNIQDCVDTETGIHYLYDDGGAISGPFMTRLWGKAEKREKPQ